MKAKKTVQEYAPQLVLEWAKRNEISPADVTIGSHKKVWWKGNCGHEWEAIVKNRVKGSGCPYCCGLRILPGFNDLATKAPKLILEWSEKNAGLKPDQVTAFSNKVVWWNGSCGHEWQSRIADRVGKGCGCPYCTSERVEQGINDLFTVRPELRMEWSERNLWATSPEVLTVKSTECVWWKCKVCGHEWRAQVRSRVAGRHPCPGCRRKHLDAIRQERYERAMKQVSFIRDFPDTFLRFHFSRRGIDAIRHDESEIGLAFDFYLPDYHTAIMIAWQIPARSRQITMARLCHRRRIRLIYIVPNGNVIYDNCHCITMTDTTPDIWEDVIGEIGRILNVDFESDIQKDIGRIIEFYDDTREDSIKS